MQRVTCERSDVAARLLRVAAVAGFALAVVASASSLEQEQLPDLIVAQVPATAQPTLSNPTFIHAPLDAYVDGARIVSVPASGDDPVVLTADFAAACDPEISFDAKTILFAGKKTRGDYWQIWRMNTDGSNKVQITRGNADNITPVFAGSRFYLNDPQPTPQIIFASTAHGWANERGGGPSFSLYGTDVQGDTLNRLTHNLNSDLSPAVLPTGRIVFSSWQRWDNRFGPDGLFALMGINIDGTDLMPFYGNHEMPRYKGMVHVSGADDRIYFIEADSTEWLGGGDIAYVSQRRPLHSYRRLSHESGGLYHSPVALPGGGLAASYRLKGPDGVYGIYRIDPESGARRSRIFAQPGWHSIDAQVVRARPIPKGRSNWLIPGSTTGVFYSLDAYRTNLTEAGVIEAGSIKHVRVIEGIPRRTRETLSEYVRNLSQASSATPDSTSNFAAERLLGIAPVAPDGSFHIRVPAETPITFQLLDANYLALGTQRAWTWVIGNENRGCIGCHEDPEMTPPNKMTEAVIKPPVELTLPPERRRSVDFRHQIAPIVESRCATGGCHDANHAAPLLTGATGGAEQARGVYRTLLGTAAERSGERYVVPGNARESPLVWMLFGKNMGSGQTEYSGPMMQMHPHDMMRLRERILFTEWIDLGAQWDTRDAVALEDDKN